MELDVLLDLDGGERDLDGHHRVGVPKVAAPVMEKPIPVSVIRAYRVGLGDRRGIGAHLRTPSGVMYVSRLDGEAGWYIDTAFPSSDGPALHRNGWGERRPEIILYPLGPAMCDALDALARRRALGVACQECHSVVPLVIDCAVCHRPLPAR